MKYMNRRSVKDYITDYAKHFFLTNSVSLVMWTQLFLVSQYHRLFLEAAKV